MAPYSAACPVIFVVAVWWPSTRSAEIAFVTGGFSYEDDSDDDDVFFPFSRVFPFFDAIVAVPQGSWQVALRDPAMTTMTMTPFFLFFLVCGLLVCRFAASMLHHCIAALELNTLKPHLCSKSMALPDGDDDGDATNLSHNVSSCS